MEDNGPAAIDNLKLEVTTLKERIVTLGRDNESLSKNLMESRSAVYRLASAERATREARVALDKAKEEIHLANVRLEGLRAEYDGFKSR